MNQITFTTIARIILILIILFSNSGCIGRTFTQILYQQSSTTNEHIYNLKADRVIVDSSKEDLNITFSTTGNSTLEKSIFSEGFNKKYLTVKCQKRILPPKKYKRYKYKQRESPIVQKRPEQVNITKYTSNKENHYKYPIRALAGTPIGRKNSLRLKNSDELCDTMKLSIEFNNSYDININSIVQESNIDLYLVHHNREFTYDNSFTSRIIYTPFVLALDIAVFPFALILGIMG
jgi:hypothetical protein